MSHHKKEVNYLEYNDVFVKENSFCHVDSLTGNCNKIFSCRMLGKQFLTIFTICFQLHVTAMLLSSISRWYNWTVST